MKGLTVHIEETYAMYSTARKVYPRIFSVLAVYIPLVSYTTWAHLASDARSVYYINPRLVSTNRCRFAPNPTAWLKHTAALQTHINHSILV
jgi:hypothetical protein